MPTTNKIFLDTSVLIEALKGTKANFYKNIITDKSLECCINDIVVSEYLYLLIGINGGKAPMSIKASGNIANILRENISLASIISDFTFLPSNGLMPSLTLKYMNDFNMLPSDAMNLATCSIHGITQSASHDKDYKKPCDEFGITLLGEF